MNIKPLFLASAISLLAGSAWAQSTTQPLNLKLPANLPASSSTAAPAASATSATAASRPAPASVSSTASTSGHGSANSAAAANNPPISTTPGVYYGDTSGRMGDNDSADSQRCDDSTYNKAQMHGSVGMGVVGGNHMSGSYQTGTVDITKNLGDCDHPTGAVSFSIGVGNGNFHGRGW